MKYLFIIILFIVGCSTNNVEKNIPKFDSNRAFQHLLAGLRRRSRIYKSDHAKLSTPDAEARNTCPTEYCCDTHLSAKSLAAQTAGPRGSSSQDGMFWTAWNSRGCCCRSRLRAHGRLDHDA